jgi:hypothetical protein
MAFRQYLSALSLFIGAPVLAAEMSISVEIPQLEVAEYHRPYVAFWLERDSAHAANLAVWYQLEKGEGGKKGEEWLKDMRQWWRRSGRTLEMPVDGISGATKAPGVHNLSFVPGRGVLAELPAGEYQLLVEAVREVGGRELLKIPFQWPPIKEETHSAKGGSELGALTLKLIP